MAEAGSATPIEAGSPRAEVAALSEAPAAEGVDASEMSAGAVAQPAAAAAAPEAAAAASAAAIVEKGVLRLRGIPFAANESNIFQFFEGAADIQQPIEVYICRRNGEKDCRGGCVARACASSTLLCAAPALVRLQPAEAAPGWPPYTA